MALIDRMNIPNSVFVSTVLATFARNKEIPGTAIGELQMRGVLLELFQTLGATDEMATEYADRVLRRRTPGKRPALSGSLQAFLDNKVSPGLLHKYDISPNDLVTSWTFDALDDPSVLEPFNIGANVDCEHHTRWERETKKAVQEEQPWTPTKGPGTKWSDDMLPKELGTQSTPEPDNGETSNIDSLLEL